MNGKEIGLIVGIVALTVLWIGIMLTGRSYLMSPVALLVLNVTSLSFFQAYLYELPEYGSSKRFTLFNHRILSYKVIGAIYFFGTFAWTLFNVLKLGHQVPGLMPQVSFAL